MLIILHLNNEVIKIYHIMHGYEKSFCHYAAEFYSGEKN